MNKLIKITMVVIFFSLILLFISTLSSFYLIYFGKSSDVKPPSIPKNLEVVANAEETVTLQWNSSKDEEYGSGLNGYIIYMSENKSSESQEYVRLSDSGEYKYVNYTVEGLEASKSEKDIKHYYFEISSIDNAGNESKHSNRIDAQTDSWDDKEPPTLPSNIEFFDGKDADHTSSITSTSVKFKWEAGIDEDSGIKKYFFYIGPSRYVDPCGETEGDETFITITKLDPSTPYQLTVFVQDKAGNWNEGTEGIKTPKFTTKAKGTN